jgi:hypothetical protein
MVLAAISFPLMPPVARRHTWRWALSRRQPRATLPVPLDLQFKFLNQPVSESATTTRLRALVPGFLVASGFPCLVPQPTFFFRCIASKFASVAIHT